MKNKTIVFNIYPDTSAVVMASAVIEKGIVSKVKVTSCVPRGQYYSCLNDASIEAENILSRGSIKKS